MVRLRLIFGHPSSWVIALGLVAGLAILVGSGPVWVWALALLGIPAQMLNEYNLHRHIFHLKPPRRQWAFNHLYRMHYGHHDFPTNMGLLFVPLRVATPVLVLNFLGLWGILHLLGFALALQIAAAVVLVGGGATFLAYEWFHTTAHLTIPKSRVERHVTALHSQHHFRDFTKWFHVTAGGEVIDRLMGTAIDREDLKAQQRMEFIRTLGMRPDDPRLIAARHHFARRFAISDDEIARAARG